MSLVRPFAGLRPVAGRADDVVAPPYDVLNSVEARERVTGRPWSFLHISKPEIDLPEGTDPYAPEVYAKAAENLAHMRDEGVLAQDKQACYYVYRMHMGEHIQTGLMATASVADYDTNRIRKHEFTRPAKEDDRVRQIEALNAQTGPVLLAYASFKPLDDLLLQIAEAKADVDVTADDGIRHELWVVADKMKIDQITQWFDDMKAIYIADGHHRSASASRVAATRRSQSDKEAAHEYFLAVIFPHNQMKIFDYNRVVKDLNGLNVETLLAGIAQRFDVNASNEPVKPTGPGEFGMYVDGQWYCLNIHDELIPQDDPVASLDVSLLADNLLEPLLAISDPRTDTRIDFVGGIRGLEGLEKRVNSGEMAVAFSVFATRMEDLMAVADANEVMPPKSTWFEPKLADGLVSHLLD